MRPLDFLGSIKLKLGVVILAAVAVTVVVVAGGEELGLSPVLTGIVAATLALAMVRFLAHGMTYPLREMVAAAKAMGRGDYSGRVTATSRDEVGELARAFNSMAAELEQIDRVRRDLVANASHELRTPLGALQARLENLVDGVETADAAVFADLLRQVERLGDLVAQLLDLSKLESGAVSLERSRLSAAELLGRVAEEWQPRAAARDLRLVVELDPAELDVDADSRRMHQVLSNLVANAIRHSPPRRGRRPPCVRGERQYPARGRGQWAWDPTRRGGAGLRALLPKRSCAICRGRRVRAGALHRALDRRDARRLDPRRSDRAARLQDRRRAAAVRALALAAALVAAILCSRPTASGSRGTTPGTRRTSAGAGLATC